MVTRSVIENVFSMNVQKYLNISVDKVYNLKPYEGSSTLLPIAGMQRYAHMFGGWHESKASIQQCMRTNDLELIGDGIHLSLFHMLGTFSFGDNRYEVHCRMWANFLKDLGINSKDLSVHVHPEHPIHKILWRRLGFQTVDDPECKWTDGTIGGYCSEIYWRGLEIGNLVNPLGHSVDVGFGLERLVQVLEETFRIDGTSLYDQSLDHISRDHFKALTALYDSGFVPSGKGPGYITRLLMRRVLSINPSDVLKRTRFGSWVRTEQEYLGASLAEGMSTPPPIDIILVESMLRERLAAKKVKDFTKADDIRKNLYSAGVRLFDLSGRTEWHTETASGVVE